MLPHILAEVIGGSCTEGISLIYHTALEKRKKKRNNQCWINDQTNINDDENKNKRALHLSQDKELSTMVKDKENIPHHQESYHR